MSNEQSIRDEIAEIIAEEEEYPHPRGYTGHADAILASPVIRRIQAEALREAADEIEATFADYDRRLPRHPKAEVATDYVNGPQWAELIVRNRADRIEQGIGHD